MLALSFSFFLSSCHVTNFKKKKKSGRNNFSLCFYLIWREASCFILAPGGLWSTHRSFHWPTGIRKLCYLPPTTPQSRCPNIDILCLHSLRNSGGQDEKQRYGEKTTSTWATGECFFFVKGKQIKWKRGAGRGLNAGEETQIAGKRRRGSNRDRGRQIEQRAL